MNTQKTLFPNVIPQYSIRLVRDRMLDGPIVTGPEAAAQVACEFLKDRDREFFLAIFLSTSARVTGLSVCHIGSINCSIVRVADSMKAAILSNAAAVIYAHNHPSGNPEPSAEDIAVTGRLVEAGVLLDIPVRDHTHSNAGRWVHEFVQEGIDIAAVLGRLEKNLPSWARITGFGTVAA
jgi:DNA repair protein RadC